MRKVGAIILLLCGAVHARPDASGDAADATRERLSAEAGAQWETFQKSLNLATITSEERIQRVDEWAVAQPNLAAASSRLQQRVVRPPTDFPTPERAPSQSLAPSERIQADLHAIDASLRQAVEAIDRTNPTPAERVRLIDDLHALRRAEVLEKSRLQREAQRLQAEETALRGAAPAPVASLDPSSLAGRQEQMLREIHGILDAANRLAPADRIAAIDAVEKDLLARQRETMRLSRESTDQLQSAPEPQIK